MIADTKYEVDAHRDRYQELRDRVVMFTHSTGAPHTEAIAADLVADDRLAIPATWYSGWSDPTLGANVLETGSNYCLEAMNAITYVSGRSPGHHRGHAQHRHRHQPRRLRAGLGRRCPLRGRPARASHRLRRRGGHPEHGRRHHGGGRHRRQRCRLDLADDRPDHRRPDRGCCRPARVPGQMVGCHADLQSPLARHRPRALPIPELGAVGPLLTARSRGRRHGRGVGRDGRLLPGPIPQRRGGEGIPRVLGGPPGARSSCCQRRPHSRGSGSRGRRDR